MDICSSSLLILALLIVASGSPTKDALSRVHQLYEGDPCSNGDGTCVNLKICKSEQDEIKKNKRPPLCAFNPSDPLTPIVCCGSDFPHRFGQTDGKSIAYDMCFRYEEEVCPKLGKQSASDLNYMALVGYKLRTNPIWGCAASLVSRRYVLSSAHCSNKTDLGVPKWVKLGVNSPEPNELYVIKQIFNHPDYVLPKKYNDIALYRLDRKVEFNEFVRPICLMHQEYFREAVENYHPISGASWKSRNGVMVAEASTGGIRIVPTGRCSFVGNTEELPYGTRNQSMVCASGTYHPPGECIATTGGGPLFVADTKIAPIRKCSLGVQIGVLSIGEQCGDTEYPGVYTNVSHFMPWIESIIWPLNTSYVSIIWSN